MKKNTYAWIWKWHFIGGLMSFPVVFVLAVTGIIYLFKDQYEQPRHSHIKEVEVKAQRLAYQEQWEIAERQWDKKINAMIIPDSEDQATEFVSGRFSGKSSLFVNPYTGKVTGSIVVSETDMHHVRKLHGELLTGSVGTRVVELVGSWLIILILSGLFLFFPRKRKEWVKLFRIRFNGPRQVFYRDMHMVGGFWFSIILLLILAGGMPWTDVWGEGFKWVQKQTNTGYPATWQGRGVESFAEGVPIAIDDIVRFAKVQDLPGEVKISLPQSPKGVFSIHNTHYSAQSKQVAIHLDQYSGQEVLRQAWDEVGILMRARMWAMAFHQGQFGFWNWLLVLFTAAGLLLLSTSAIIAYLLRKKVKGPTTNQVSAPVHWAFYGCVAVMALFLPLFGVSVLLIIMYEGARALMLKLNSKETLVGN